MGCEECSLPGAALRSLDFKAAKRAVARKQHGTADTPLTPGMGTAAERVSGGGGKAAAAAAVKGGGGPLTPLTLDGAKASLRAFAACLKAAGTRSEGGGGGFRLTAGALANSGIFSARPGGNGGGGGSSGAVATCSSQAAQAASARALVQGGAMLAALEAEAEAAAAEEEAETGGAGRGAGGGVAGAVAASSGVADDRSLDFQEFLVALHRKRPHEAVEAGWLTDFGKRLPKKTRGSGMGGAAAEAGALRPNDGVGGMA